jgi:D-alanyl-D-alanine carboxypeptidase
VEEGKLSLDDPLSKWIDGLPNGKSITIRHLLEHRSGLFSANEDMVVRAARRYAPVDEQKRVAALHGAMFCPGENWRYSNTGYTLLGAIIEKVTGQTYPQAISERIIRPLGLTTMRAIIPGTVTEGIAPLVSDKENPIDPSWAGAAGPIVASASDMVRVWQALLGNKLLKRSTVESMFHILYPMFDPGTWYGLGVTALDVPQPDGTTKLWLGHAGGTPGAGALVVYVPEQRVFVAVALTGSGSAAASVNFLLRAIDGN